MSRALDSSKSVALYRYYADRYNLVYRTERPQQRATPGL